jgi:non-heme chloroperoxidase
MSYVTATDKTSLYVKDWGSDRPAILIHRWPLSADS